MSNLFVFIAISGVGFLLDMTVYIMLIGLLDISPIFANITSSFLGVTFVWLVSLRRVFHLEYEGKNVYLIIYWMYQITSILAYSLGVGYLAHTFFTQMSTLMNPDQVMGISKIIVTPFNLVTNFIFMSCLTHYARKSDFDSVRVTPKP
jgi:putative flippase GtrA